ncbi:MAG: MTH1187 family thiamine-binding protein [Pirellulales bacterium]
MVLLEFSVTPIGAGESVSSQVARCIEIVEASGLAFELHAMGTIIEGELDEVMDVMRRCIDAVAQDNPRVSCTAKLDCRRSAAGRLITKVESVERQLGRKLKQ